MLAQDFRYYRGGRDCYEAVELTVLNRDGSYKTTCVVNVNLLLCGIQAHPCGDGDDLKLTAWQRLKVLDIRGLAEKRPADV